MSTTKKTDEVDTEKVKTGGVSGLSYAEYLAEQDTFLKDQNADVVKEIEAERDAALTYAANVKNNAYANALATEATAIQDADNSYARNLASYGARADALASMGLSGGGYSQYLDSQAYAANQNARLAAAEQKATAQRAADTAYADTSYKLNAEYGKQIRDTNLKYSEMIAKNAEELAAYNEEKKIASDAVANGIIDQIYNDPNGINTGYVDALYNNGNGDIDATKYGEIKAEWLKNLALDESMFTSKTGERLSKADAEKLLNNPWLEDTEQKKKLQEVFDKLYNAKTYNVGIAYSDDEDIDELADEGNEFDVVYAGKEFDVESGGEITDSNILELGKDVTDGQLFGSGDRIFVKKDGRVFEIRGRGNTTTNDWAKLTDLFFEKTSTREERKATEEKEADKDTEFINAVTDFFGSESVDDVLELWKSEKYSQLVREYPELMSKAYKIFGTEYFKTLKENNTDATAYELLMMARDYKK